MVLKARSLLIAVSLIRRTRDCAFTAEKPATGRVISKSNQGKSHSYPHICGGYVTTVPLFCFFSEQAGVIFSG